MLRPCGGVRSAAKNSVSSGSAGICHQCSIASKLPSNQSELIDVPSTSCTAHVDADVAQLPLQRLRDVLADREAGLRDERERERLPVLLADAVAVAVAPAGLVEQRPRPGRIVRIAWSTSVVNAQDSGWIGPCMTGARLSRIVRTMRSRSMACSQRAPDAHVAKGRERRWLSVTCS